MNDEGLIIKTKYFLQVLKESGVDIVDFNGENNYALNSLLVYCLDNQIRVFPDEDNVRLAFDYLNERRKRWDTTIVAQRPIGKGHLLLITERGNEGRSSGIKYILTNSSNPKKLDPNIRESLENSSRFFYDESRGLFEPARNN